jgi:hypothetical protein
VAQECIAAEGCGAAGMHQQHLHPGVLDWCMVLALFVWICGNWDTTLPMHGGAHAHMCRGIGPRALSNGINSAVFFAFFGALQVGRQEWVGCPHRGVTEVGHTEPQLNILAGIYAQTMQAGISHVTSSV